MKSLLVSMVILWCAWANAPAQATSIKAPDTKALCSAICSNDKKAFQQAVWVLLKNDPSDSILRLRNFYHEAAYNTLCLASVPENGSEDCSHEELNLVQTAIMVKADQIIEYVVKETPYDFDRKLTSGKSTLEWLEVLLNTGSFPNEWEKKNFQNNREFILSNTYKRRILKSIVSNDTSEYKKVATEMKGLQYAYAMKFADAFCAPGTFTCTHSQHTVLEAAFCAKASFIIDFFYSNPDDEKSAPFTDEFKAWLKKECAERKFQNAEEKSFWMGWKKLLDID